MWLSRMISPPPRYNVLTEDGSDFEDKTETLEPIQLPLRPTRRRCSPIYGALIAVLIFIVFLLCALLIDSRKDLHRSRTELEAARTGSCATTVQESHEFPGSDGGLISQEGHEAPGSVGGHGLFDAYGIFPEFGFENRMFGLSTQYEEADEKSEEAWAIYQTSSSSTNLRIACRDDSLTFTTSRGTLPYY